MTNESNHPGLLVNETKVPMATTGHA